jgi:hypothetical protein
MGILRVLISLAPVLSLALRVPMAETSNKIMTTRRAAVGFGASLALFAPLAAKAGNLDDESLPSSQEPMVSEAYAGAIASTGNMAMEIFKSEKALLTSVAALFAVCAIPTDVQGSATPAAAEEEANNDDA